MKSHFEMMGGYNAWANTRLYDAAAALDDDVYRREYGAFFGSIHRTLNHILVGDRIWMQRFTGSGDAPRTLDAVLYVDFADLRAAREAEDSRISAYIASLSKEDLTGKFKYRTVTNPRDVEQPLGPALTHFFNIRPTTGARRTAC